MLGDGIVPSNVGTGYLARMVLRRTKRLCDNVGVDAPLDELVDMQAERLGYENRDTIRDIVRTEVEKYRETGTGGRRVEQLAEEYAKETSRFRPTNSSNSTTPTASSPIWSRRSLPKQAQTSPFPTISTASSPSATTPRHR